MSETAAKGPKEQVYDDAILPLMRQVRALCHAHQIAMVAGFDLDESEGAGPLLASSVVLPGGERGSARLMRAADALQQSTGAAFCVVVSEEPGDGRR